MKNYLKIKVLKIGIFKNYLKMESFENEIWKLDFLKITLFNPKIYKPYPSTIPNVLQVTTWRDGMSFGGDEQNG